MSFGRVVVGWSAPSRSAAPTTALAKELTEVLVEAPRSADARPAQLRALLAMPRIEVVEEFPHRVRRAHACATMQMAAAARAGPGTAAGAARRSRVCTALDRCAYSEPFEHTALSKGVAARLAREPARGLVEKSPLHGVARLRFHVTQSAHAGG